MPSTLLVARQITRRSAARTVLDTVYYLHLEASWPASKRKIAAR